MHVVFLFYFISLYLRVSSGKDHETVRFTSMFFSSSRENRR